MAFDAFIWFESDAGGPPIPGETQDKSFAGNDAIQIVSYLWTAENTTTIGSAGGGAGAGKAKLNPLKFKAVIGRQSPVLFKYLATGLHFKAAHLALRNGKNPPFWMLDLGLVFVTAVSQSFDAATDLPLEEWTLAYGSVKETFGAGGNNGAPGQISQGWNQVTNSENLSIGP